MFAHNLAIRKPLPTGKKDWTKLGGYLHADWHHFTVNPFIGGRHYPLAVQSVWCVSEFTRQNGATYVWPRSHLSLTVPPEQPKTLPEGWIRAEAPAGSAILWDSALWHTSGANCGTAPRYSLVFYFQRWWVRGFNDAYRLCPPEAQGSHDGGGAAPLGLGGRGPAQYPLPGNDAGTDRSPHAPGEGRPQHCGVLTAVVIDSMTGTGMLSETWVGSRYTAHLSERNCLLR